MQNSVSTRSIAPWVVGSIALAAALAAPGYLDDGKGGNGSPREYLIAIAIIAVGAVVVFGLVVPRGLARGRAGTAAVILSVLALLSLPVFWLGLTPVLAAGGIVLGWAGWSAERGRVSCRVAVALGTLALAGDCAIVLQDWLANR